MTGVRKIDLATAQEVIGKIVAENPDYIYEALYVEKRDRISCVNWVLNEAGERVPSCVVGHAFGVWGVLDKVEDLLSVDTVVRELGDDLQFTDAAVRYLGELQALQDTSTPWGEADRKAREYIEYKFNSGEYDRHTESYVDHDYEDDGFPSPVEADPFG